MVIAVVMERTLFDKIWDNHVVYQGMDTAYGNPSLLYIDCHLIHEVTSPQAFAGLKQRGRTVRRPELTFATMDHNVPTTNRSIPLIDGDSTVQMHALSDNCKEFDITLFDMLSPQQGIVHVIGPELGLTLPGMTIVCGDSHTSTHGAFGALAMGIGTSDVEHVLATQCLWMQKPKSLNIKFVGTINDRRGLSAKDIILATIRNIGISGGIGSVIEYSGEGISTLSMEQRMTICNMSIEGGARAGLMAPDDVTFDYIRGRPFAPSGEKLDKLIGYWQSSLITDSETCFDKSISMDLSKLAPQVSWGTNPSMVVDVTENIPYPEEFADGNIEQEKSAKRALEYMGLEPGVPITEINIDRVFIGSCTNARLEDLIDASRMIEGRTVSSRVNAMVVPGSQSVKRAAEEKGIDRIFKKAGFEWRESGCSMCLGMNPDILAPKQRCASTSNRNFEGRQGFGGRTHLVSPIMAAAAAVEGKFVDVRDWF
jgi:3-isopropylmalate/(R)-2-methylmalate dehydratase large subunit